MHNFSQIERFLYGLVEPELCWGICNYPFVPRVEQAKVKMKT